MGNTDSAISALREFLLISPVFLTKEHHAELNRFVRKEPRVDPQVFMPVGTIKSGKSTIVKAVLPGMVAAAYASGWPSSRLRPVIFTYEFPLGASAEDAAMHLSHALARFGRDINVPFDEESSAGAALDNLPINLEEFAECIEAGGGELWLLLDELQGPGLGSTPAMAQHFTYTFKQIVAKVSPNGRVVATGSGLMALLNSFRTAHVNGFALWDAVTFLSLGREPSEATARGMAEAILLPYSEHWPASARAGITPEMVLRALAPGAHGGLTSRRPALVSYILGRMGDARTGSVDEIIHAAVGDAVGELKAESVRDTLCALIALDFEERRALRAVAAGSYSCAELDAIRKRHQGFKEGSVCLLPEKLAALFSCVRDAGEGADRLRLQPPYSALIQSCLRAGGELAVCLHDGKIDLDYTTRKNLVFTTEPAKVILSAGLQGMVSRTVLDSLARNGIGVRPVGSSVVRPPATAAEFDAVPALRHLKGMLSAGYIAGPGRQPSLSTALRNAAVAFGAFSPRGATFADTIGWELLLAFRHSKAHIWADAQHLVGNGLTAAVIADAMYATACALTRPGGPFTFQLTGSGELLVLRQGTTVPWLQVGRRRRRALKIGAQTGRNQR